jgi:hypothetical protein
MHLHDPIYSKNNNEQKRNKIDNIKRKERDERKPDDILDEDVHGVAQDSSKCYRLADGRMIMGKFLDQTLGV